jgi:SnoaL-like domain
VDCGPFSGDADAYVGFAQGFLANIKSSHHLIGQVHIKVDGTTAHGEVYFIAWHRIVEEGVDKDLLVAGRYIDEYQDRGTGWKIAKRREVIDWARTDPAADGFLREATGLVMGARGAQDFSNQRNWPA